MDIIRSMLPIQKELALAYMEQQRIYKLEKNRAEKMRVRELKVKKTLKKDEN